MTCRILLALLMAGIALLAVAAGLVQLAAGMILAGLGIAPAIACLYLLVDRLAPAGTVTEAFTWVTTAFATGFAAGRAGPLDADARRFEGVFHQGHGSGDVGGAGHRIPVQM